MPTGYCTPEEPLNTITNLGTIPHVSGSASIQFIFIFSMSISINLLDKQRSST